MQVKVSNPMKKFVAVALTGLGSVTLEKMTYEQFKLYVDYDPFRHETDWDGTKNTFKVLKVVYPFDCYASPAYITTRDLNKVFRESDGTAEGFTQALIAQYEI